MQPPELTDVRLKLVNDMHEGPRGPAWNFEVAYNKLSSFLIRPYQLAPLLPRLLFTVVKRCMAAVSSVKVPKSETAYGFAIGTTPS